MDRHQFGDEREWLSDEQVSCLSYAVFFAGKPKWTGMEKEWLSEEQVGGLPHLTVHARAHLFCWKDWAGMEKERLSEEQVGRHFRACGGCTLQNWARRGGCRCVKQMHGVFHVLWRYMARWAGFEATAGELR